ncbi:MAG TPA: HEAT repeat domain-containing protein [bacterium (Candidatus Stahlbacteria)]|nr:HEAT repeat domain-containing protein [Candidatus Stahlbacteria bacterium]
MTRWLIATIAILSCGLPPKDKSFSVLKDGLNDKSEKIQVSAAGAQAHLNRREGYDRLINFLNSEDDEIVAMAINELAATRDTVTARFLKKLLNHKSPLIRRLTIDALADLGVIEPRVINMLDDKSIPIIIAACNYVGRLEATGAKRKLRTLSRRKEPELRVAAKIALGLLGTPDAGNWIKKEMTEKDPLIWEHAIKGLGMIKDTSSIQFLEEIIDEGIWPLDICAADALMRMGIRNDEFIISLLTNRDPMIRIRAISVVSELGDRKLLRYVLPLTEDPYLNVALQAIDFISKFKTHEVKEKLTKLLDTENPYVRIAAAEAYLLVELQSTTDR